MESSPSATPLRSAPPLRLSATPTGRRGESPHHGGGHRAGTVQPLPRPRSRPRRILGCSQRRVVLPVHLPVAHQAHELLAHPVSAPGATHWAGLRRPRGGEFDHGHAREGGLVLVVTVNLATGPGGDPSVHFPRWTTRAVEVVFL